MHGRRPPEVLCRVCSLLLAMFVSWMIGPNRPEQVFLLHHKDTISNSVTAWLPFSAGDGHLQVLIMSASKGMLGERMTWANKFWQNDIAAQYFLHKENPFMPDQMSHAAAQGIPFGVVLRPTELEEVRRLPSLAQCIRPRSPSHISAQDRGTSEMSRIVSLYLAVASHLQEPGK